MVLRKNLLVRWSVKRWRHSRQSRTRSRSSGMAKTCCAAEDISMNELWVPPSIVIVDVVVGVLNADFESVKQTETCDTYIRKEGAIGRINQIVESCIHFSHSRIIDFVSTRPPDTRATAAEVQHSPESLPRQLLKLYLGFSGHCQIATGY